MNAAFLGLGGNVGDRLENLRKMRATLVRDCGKLLTTSRVYETEAWGSDTGNSYLNQVVELHTFLSAEDLVQKVLQIESELGRERHGTLNSDRTADIDVLFFNDRIIDLPGLSVPHPRLHLRNFVLVPLAEIAPDLIHPLLKKSVSVLLKECGDSLKVLPFEDL